MLSLAFEVYILFDSLLKCPCHFLCHMNVRPYFQCILTVHPSLQTLTSGRRRHGSSELQHASFPLQTFLGSSRGISGLFLLLSMRSVRVHVELSKHVFRKLREESNVWNQSRKWPWGVCFRKAEMKRKKVKRTDAHRHGLSCLPSGLKSWCSGAESLEMWLPLETRSFRKGD